MKILLKPNPHIGEKRIRKNKFLWWPRQIGLDLRWLRFDSWEEVYEYGPWSEYGLAGGHWFPTKWLT